LLEDLGDETLSLSSVDDQQLFARWLATLHRWNRTPDWGLELPDRGPAGYLRHLQSAHAQIVGNLNRPWVTDRGRTTLDRLLRFLDRLERDWTRVEAICGRCPRTIVHGDLVAKNVRVRRRGSVRELVVLDWEMAGFGAPSIDLKLLADDLEYYASSMQSVWPDLSLADVRDLADVGRIFRTLVVIDWQVYDLAHPWCSLKEFEPLEARLEAAARCIETRG
jgi:aminoglycoside phosphotransferase (APT) family kinase protein